MTEDYPKVALTQIRKGDSIKVENSDGSALAVGYVQAVEPTGPGNPFIGLSTSDTRIGGLTWWACEGDTYWRLCEGVEEPQVDDNRHWWDKQVDGQQVDIPVKNAPHTGDADMFRVTKKSSNHYVVTPYYRGRPFNKPKHMSRKEWISIFNWLGQFTPVDRGH